MRDPRLAALALAAIALPAAAQTAPTPQAIVPAADPSLAARADELIGLLGGTGDFDGYFSAAFHTALPKEKWDAVVAALAAQLGKPRAIASIKPSGPTEADLRIAFERGTASARIAVESTAPHRVAGLLFTGVEVAGDTFDKLTADFRALPGKSGFGLYFLDAPPGANAGTATLPVAPPTFRVRGTSTETSAPLGSAFKLWVLGELVREVNAGERKWSDVVPVGAPSLPSGILQSWPPASPVTLQTLATLMISISDNTATDTLVTLEGPKLDAFVGTTGASALAPVLTTRQMFALKSSANADLAARWAATISPTARRRLLDANAVRLAATPIDAAIFGGKPAAIDTLEWFASPTQTALMLDRLRADPAARAILAVNPGADAATAAKFEYVGFKGGSEPGVITLNYLVKRRDGRWMAVAGNWHRPDADVDTATFSALMTRALAIAADAPLP